MQQYGAQAGMRLEDTDLFRRALNISEPRDHPENPPLETPIINMKTVRRVEVPYTRQVGPDLPTTITNVAVTG